MSTCERKREGERERGRERERGGGGREGDAFIYEVATEGLRE